MRIYPLNEKALTIELGEIVSEEVHHRVMALRDEILRDPVAGILDVVTAYTTVTVFFDPIVIARSPLHGNSPLRKMEFFLSEKINQLKDIAGSSQGSTVVIPVCYEDEFSPDLEWVASYHKTVRDDIIRRHTNRTFTVFMIGFTPGFPYMGILPPELESPRKQNPRTKVPAGSVGLAGRQTGIYPFETPGGWQIIGRTPLKLFDATSATPSLLKPGDKVKFEPISKDQFMTLNKVA